MKHYTSQKITPFLWYDTEAEEAMNLYISIFKDAEVKDLRRYPDGAPGGMSGKVMTCTFTLFGQEFIALNAGPHFKFNESVSFFVTCENQEEVDKYWNALIADGGQESQCGWLKDKFGLSWQIIPRQLGELMGDPDRAKAARVMQAMMQMKKIDIARLEEAANS
jgi:predicted 3-demethylubiquinone-9 3-methyltransferase (glyoxalase superfamily)